MSPWSDGQLGVGSGGLDMNNLESIPVRVKMPGRYACALEAQTLYLWLLLHSVPNLAFGVGTDVQSVSCGFGHTLAITEEGEL